MRDLNSIGMSLSKNSNPSRPKNLWRDAVSKFGRAVTVKMTVKNRKTGNLQLSFKVVYRKKEPDETKNKN